MCVVTMIMSLPRPWCLHCPAALGLGHVHYYYYYYFGVRCARPGESEDTLSVQRPQPHTTNPWKEEKDKTVGDKKERADHANWKSLALLLKPVSPCPDRGACTVQQPWVLVTSMPRSWCLTVQQPWVLDELRNESSVPDIMQQRRQRRCALD